MVKFQWKLCKKMSLDKLSFKDWYTNDLAACVIKNDLIGCTCCDEKNSHKMRCIRLDCNSTQCNIEKLCEVKYKILQCTRKANVYVMYKLNDHPSGVEVNKKSRGISNKVKEIINNFVFDNDISMPKKIQIKLGKKKYTEGNDIIDQPTLEQIQNYIKYMKTKVSDSNKISDVKKFVDENKYNEGLEDQDFFVFGSKIGNGTDSDHFQIGFSSRDLMNRIPSGVVFHCDGFHSFFKI